MYAPHISSAYWFRLLSRANESVGPVFFFILEVSFFFIPKEGIVQIFCVSPTSQPTSATASRVERIVSFLSEQDTEVEHCQLTLQPRRAMTLACSRHVRDASIVAAVALSAILTADATAPGAGVAVGTKSIAWAQLRPVQQPGVCLDNNGGTGTYADVYACVAFTDSNAPNENWLLGSPTTRRVQGHQLSTAAAGGLPLVSEATAGQCVTASSSACRCVRLRTTPSSNAAIFNRRTAGYPL